MVMITSVNVISSILISMAPMMLPSSELFNEEAYQIAIRASDSALKEQGSLKLYLTNAYLKIISPLL